MTVYNTRTEHSKDNWSTPQYFFDLLDKEFQFTLDPCASKENHKCSKYYTIKENGLKQSWRNETVFCNPPYKNIDEWIKKSYLEALSPTTLVVMLIPVRTDTKYWHEYVMKAIEVRLCKGRINFELNGISQGSPNFASCVVVFDFSGKTSFSTFYHKKEDLLKKDQGNIVKWV